MGNPDLAAALSGAEAEARDAARAQLKELATGAVAAEDLGATVAAVIGALPAVEPRLRAELLVWLADVQVGGHDAQTTRPPERKRKDELPEDRAPARAAVAEHAAAIIALLPDPDPDVRSAAALALGFCTGIGAEAKQALAGRLSPEPEAGVDATIILALVRLGAGFRAPIDDPAVAAAIAIATAFDGPPNLDALIAASALGPVPHCAFGAGRLGEIAATIAIEHAFAPADAPKLYEDLDGKQRTVLEGVATTRAPIAWRRLGLPATADGRRRFLFLDPAGPTDRFVPQGDAEVPLWFALHALEAKAARGDYIDAERDALLEPLTAAERLLVYLDRDAYGVAAALPPWTLDELLAAATADPDAARDAVDAYVAAPHAEPLGAEVERAIAATRATPAAP